MRLKSKENKKGSNTLLVLSFLLGLCMLASCYNNVDGCIDPESTNYEVAADFLCEDCCIYPQVQLSIFHQNIDTTLNLGDTLINDSGQEYVIVDFVYLLSDFYFNSPDSVLQSSDGIELLKEDGTILIEKDDVIRVDRGNFRFEIGTLIYDGPIDSISFIIGISDNFNSYSFAESVKGHPLTADSDSLRNDETLEYVFQRIQIAQGEMLGDTVIYDIDKRSSISFPIDIQSERGSDKSIIIEAQYGKWFENVDFETMTKEEIEDRVAENSGLMFRERE